MSADERPIASVGDLPTVLPDAPTIALPTAPPGRPDVPGYEILSELGRGGMGVVYHARQVGLNRTVALKMVLAGEQAGPKDLVRFLAEAEAVAAIDHPNVVRVYESGEHAGRPFLAMEYLDGGSLAGRLKEVGRLAPRDAAEVVRKIALGVEAAHAAGIVHRDLKPANVLLTAAGEPKVTDFGLAKRGTGADLTNTGAVMGTPAYMSPEQASGKAKFVGPGADVYALGVILYECLTGTVPFTGGSVVTLLLKVATEEPPPVSRLAPGVPRDLALVCHKCLEKDPKDRYPTAAALTDDLARFAAGEPVMVRPAGRAERAAKWARRNPTRAAAYSLTLLAVVLIGLTTGAGWLWQRAEEARRVADENRGVAEAARDEAAGQRTAAEVARDAEAGQRAAAEAARDAEARQRAATEVARRDAEEIRDALAKEREKLAAVEYGRAIQVAYQEWREDNPLVTARLLAASRSGLRGWEWRYLHRLSNAHLLALPGSNTAAYSPDGRRLLIGGGTTCICDAETGAVIRILRFAARPGRPTGYSPDGRRVVSAARDGTVFVWDAETGKEVAALKAADLSVNSVALSPDGRRVVTAESTAVTARVWDTATGKQVLALGDEHRAVLSAAYSPDGRRIAGGLGDGRVRVWDAGTGEPVAVLAGLTGGVYTLAFSPDGRRVAAAAGDTARAWDVETGREVVAFRGHTDRIMSVAFGPGGRRVVTASYDGTARVWDADTGAGVAVLKGHTGVVTTAEFRPDGKRVVTASYDGTARVWDLAGDDASVLRGHTGDVLCAAFTPDGRRVVTGSADRTARVWDVATGRTRLTLTGHAGGVESAVVSPDGRRVLTTGQDEAARLWDTTTGEPVAAFRAAGAAVRAAAFSPDGTRVVTGMTDTTAQVWDAATGRPVLTLKGDAWGGVHAVAFSPDGTRIATAASFSAQVWDAATGKQLRFIQVYGPSPCVGFSPDGRRVVTGGNSVPHVWDVETGRRVLTLDGVSSVEAAVYTPDGRRIVTAGPDRAVRVWDAERGFEVLTLKGHTGAVLAAAFSPDGHRLVTAGKDGTARIWDAGPLGAKEVAPFPRPAN